MTDLGGGCDIALGSATYSLRRTHTRVFVAEFVLLRLEGALEHFVRREMCSAEAPSLRALYKPRSDRRIT